MWPKLVFLCGLNIHFQLPLNMLHRLHSLQIIPQMASQSAVTPLSTCTNCHHSHRPHLGVTLQLIYPVALMVAGGYKGPPNHHCTTPLAPLDMLFWVDFCPGAVAIWQWQHNHANWRSAGTGRAPVTPWRHCEDWWTPPRLITYGQLLDGSVYW